MKTLKEELFKESNAIIINGRISKIALSKLKKLNLYDTLLEYTSFLISPTLRERIYVIDKGITHQSLCGTCSIPVKFIDPKKGYRSYCSKKCQGKSKIVRNKVKNTMLTHYGVESAFNLDGVREKAVLGTKSDASKNKRKATCQKKYGVDYNSQALSVKENKRKTCQKNWGVDYSITSDIVKNKIKKTTKERYSNETFFGSDIGKKSIKESMQHKYGVDNFMKTSEFHNMAQNTIMEKYGVSNISQHPEIIEKIKQSHIKKYGAYFSCHKISKDTMEKLQDSNWLITQHKTLSKSLTQIADELGDVTHKTVWNYFVSHDISISRFCFSYPEKLLVEHIQKTYNTEVITNTRSIIKPYELDIYLPEYKLAIEFNGVYWHRPEVYGSKIQWFLYHQNKEELCNLQGIKLLHIWENYLDHFTLINNATCSIINNNLEEVYGEVYG